MNDKGIRRPVILFIDGHKSHMTLPLIKFCRKNQIILYALPPNTTHILQPADVSVFRPLKHQWKITVRTWQSKQEDPNASMTKINFCQVFEEALSGTNMVLCIKNGFRKCGLFPLESYNVHYSKCTKNFQEKNYNESNNAMPGENFQPIQTLRKEILKPQRRF